MESRRRCIVTGEIRDPALLLRFVVDPENRVVPDVAAKLPGRGVWLSASREVLAKAVQKGAFARAARRNVEIDENLADRIEALLVARCLDLVGLARRASQVVSGAERVRQALRHRRAAVLLEAADGAPGNRLAPPAKGPRVPVVGLFSRAELGLALGRGNVVHAALTPGGIAEHLLAEVTRLEGFRRADQTPENGESGPSA